MGREFDQSKYPNWIDPKEVNPYERNAKLHPQEQIDGIAASISRFGWQQDTVITADNYLVIGHGRRLAALQLGCMMPYHRVGKNADDLTDAEIKALRLADNLTAISGTDYGLLNIELKELKSFEMSDFGFAPVADDSLTEIPAGAADEYDYDDGFEEYQDPLSDEELKQYEDNAPEYLMKRHVIITYRPEQADELFEMLGMPRDDSRVVFDINEI